jgi:hypothetical protein
MWMILSWAVAEVAPIASARTEITNFLGGTTQLFLTREGRQGVISRLTCAAVPSG